MSKFFRIAFRNLFKNKSRTIILGLSITITSIILTLLMSLTSGIEDTMLKSSTTLLTGHVNVAGFYKISSSSAAPVITDHAKLDKIVRTVVKDPLMIVDRVKGWGKVISERYSIQYPMWGVDILQEKDMKQVLELVPSAGEKAPSGSFECMQETGGILLFDTHAKRLDVDVGDSVTVSMPTYRNMNNTKDLVVCAVLKDIGFLSQFGIFLHKKDLREI